MKPTHLIIGILTCLVLLLSTCVGCLNERLKDACPEIVASDSIPGDSVPTRIAEENPEPDIEYLPGDTIYEDSIVYVHDTIPSIVDTQAILADYFKRRDYTFDYDTSEVEASVKAVVTQNKLTRFSLDLKNNRVTEIKNTYENPPKNRFLLGGFADWDSETFGAGLGAGWLTKKYTLFQYQYDLLNGSHRATIMMQP